MAIEALEKTLVYERVNPDNTQQLKEVLGQEQAGFENTLDYPEPLAVIQFIAQRGCSWLQYIIEAGQRVATGVIEFIPLVKALAYDSRHLGGNLSISQFASILGNQKVAFRDARRFATDQDIIYHHTIAMSKRGQGYGTLLLQYALNNISDKLVICLIDAVQFDGCSQKLQLAPNENSFTLHLKAGFVLAGVVEPPVYDKRLTYYSFVKPKKIAWASVGREKEMFLNLAFGSAKKALDDVRKYTSMGYLGVAYSKETHQMRFLKARL